jgi:hypothetical protein
VQQQRLDVVILRKGRGRFSERLPDGLDDLVTHNLITFKSYRQPLTDWALKELLGHYVSYRKLISPSPDALLPEAAFRLYAVCARYPHNLAGQVPLEELRQGVYQCRWGTDLIRVVVVRQLPQTEHNAPLHLFSAVPQSVRFGQDHFRQRSPDTSSLLRLLFQKYQGEGLTMTYTMENFRRDYAKEHFKDLTPEERREALQSVPLEEVLKSLPLEEILRSLLPEEILQSLPPEVLENYLQQHRSVPLEEILKSLPLETLESYLQQHREATPSSPKKSQGSQKGRKRPKR